MKKIYIDEILKKGDKHMPGAGSYAPNFSVVKNSPCRFSMRIKHADLTLKRQKAIPGPGTYKDSSLTGVKPINSKMASTFSFGFGRDERFRGSANKSPSPVNYSPKQDLN